MGTRHAQTVISKEGELKISQYGQWDGYPSSQGVNILKYLRKGNLEKYQENLSKIQEITDKEGKEVEKDKDWIKNYPYLSRDCGSNIHQMIEDDKVKFVNLIDEKEAKKWCEGFYTICFKRNEFISVYHNKTSTFKLDDLPTDKEYLKVMEEEETE